MTDNINLRLICTCFFIVFRSLRLRVKAESDYRGCIGAPRFLGVLGILHFLRIGKIIYDARLDQKSFLRVSQYSLLFGLLKHRSDSADKVHLVAETIGAS